MMLIRVSLVPHVRKVVGEVLTRSSDNLYDSRPGGVHLLRHGQCLPPPGKALLRLDVGKASR